MTRRVRLVIPILIAGVFILDLLAPRGMAVWFFYLLPLLGCSQLSRRNAAYLVAAACTLLIGMGFVLDIRNVSISGTLGNRALAISILWMTAWLLEMRQRLEVERDRFFDLSIDMLAVAGFDGFFKQLNPEWPKVLGWSEAELLGCPWLDFVHPDDRAATMKARQKLSEGQTVVSFDNRYRCRDGSYRWISWNSFPLVDEQLILAVARDITERKGAEEALRESEARYARGQAMWDEQGQPLRMTGSITDITERKRAEEALRESEERLSLAVAATDLGIFEHDHGRNAIYWSPTMRRIFGWDANEPASLAAYLELVHPEERAEVAAAVQHAHDPAGDGQYRVEHRIVRRDGSVRWVNILSRTMFAGSAPERHRVRAIGTVADITERKRMEEALRLSERRYHRLIESNVIGVTIANTDGRITEASDLFLRMVGYSREELQAERVRWDTITPPEWRAVDEHIIEQLHATGVCKPVEKEYFHKDGHRVPVLVSVALIEGRSDDGVCFIVDLTETKRADETLRDSEKKLRLALDAAKRTEEEILASRERLAQMSRQLIATQENERRHLARELHDEIGQVLTAVFYNLNVLKTARDPITPSMLDDSLAVVEHAIQQVRNLSLDLRPSMIDDLGLAPTVRWYAERLAQRTGLKIHLTAPPSGVDLPAEVKNTCFRVAQEAMTNIVRHARATRIWIELYQCEQEVRLVIRDDGVGFDVTAAQRHAMRGRSIGLLGMQERVELIGGQIVMESDPGKGSSVRVRFDLHELAEKLVKMGIVGGGGVNDEAYPDLAGR